MPRWPSTTIDLLRSAAQQKLAMPDLDRSALVDHNGKQLTATQISDWWKRNCDGYRPPEAPKPVARDGRTEAQRVAAQLDHALAMVLREDPSFRFSTTWAGSRFNKFGRRGKRSVNRQGYWY